MDAGVRGAADAVRVRKTIIRTHVINDTVRTVLSVLRNIFQEENYEANGNISGYARKNICIKWGRSLYEPYNIDRYHRGCSISDRPK